jgi:hypothetical protein
MHILCKGSRKERQLLVITDRQQWVAKALNNVLQPTAHLPTAKQQ